MTNRHHILGDFIGIALIGLVILLTPIGRRSIPPSSAYKTSLLQQPQKQLSKLQLSESSGNMPIYFIENQGQLDDRVAYYVRGRDKALYFTAQGITFALTGKNEQPAEKDESSPFTSKYSLEPARFNQETKHNFGTTQYAIKLDFIGANAQVKPTGQDQTAAVISYFNGQSDHWQTGLKTYSTIVYRDLWPGIDLVYSGTVNRLKYQFVVKPGADPSQIQLAYRGATKVKLNQEGQLVVTTPAGAFHDDRPYSYQEAEGRQEEVSTAYELGPASEGDGQIYGFRIGAYDPSRPLVLDPAVLVYSGFLGGTSEDQGFGIAVDNFGNAYITGITNCSQGSFPVNTGPSIVWGGRV